MGGFFQGGADRVFGDVCGPQITDTEAGKMRKFIVDNFNKEYPVGSVLKQGPRVVYTATEAYLKEGAPVVGITETPGGKKSEVVAVASLANN